MIPENDVLLSGQPSTDTRRMYVASRITPIDSYGPAYRRRCKTHHGC